MATRHQVREAVIGLLYARDIGNEDNDKFMDDIFEERKIRNQQRDFAKDLYKGIIENLESIDNSLNIHLKEWEMNRVGAIERAILRLGAYEILYGELDKPVVINEAIELAKELGAETSPKFINGVLDSLKKDL